MYAKSFRSDFLILKNTELRLYTNQSITINRQMTFNKDRAIRAFFYLDETIPCSMNNKMIYEFYRRSNAKNPQVNAFAAMWATDAPRYILTRN